MIVRQKAEAVSEPSVEGEDSCVPSWRIVMRLILSALVVLLLVPDMQAGGRRRQRQYVQQVAAQPMHMVPGPYAGKDSSETNALAELNAARAKYNLKPYLPDPGLTQAANTCAERRASRLIAGHLPEGDLSTCVPSGVHAEAAGAAAWEPSSGWGSCCTYATEFTYAGAAWRMGRDGRRYMSLFVR